MRFRTRFRPEALGLGDPPWLAAHRGASADAPENTLESVALAIEQGADLAEVDVQLTADGRLAVCHDSSLDRVAKVSLVVERQPLPALQAAYPALPELSRLLAEVPTSFPLNLEIKRYEAPRPAIAEALLRALPGRGRILLSSFDHQLLAAVQAVLPGIPVAPLVRHDPGTLLAAGERLAAWSLHTHRKAAGPDLVAGARFAGRPLLVYTVDEAAEARCLLNAGVSGIFTNRPGALRRELEERG